MRIKVEYPKSSVNRIRKGDLLLLEISEEGQKVPTIIKVKVEDFIHKEERCASCKVSLQLQEKHKYMRSVYCGDCIKGAVEDKRKLATDSKKKGRPFTFRNAK